MSTCFFMLRGQIARCLPVLLGTALVLGSLSGTAHASFLGSLLTFDGPQHTPGGLPSQGGGEDFLSDESLSVYGGDLSSFAVGDRIWGIATFSDVEASPLFNNQTITGGQVAAVYSGQIVGAGSGGSYSLAPIGNAADPFDLRSILDPSVQGGLSDDSMITFLSTTTEADPLVPSTDPMNWTPGQVSDNATGFSTTNNWSWELTADLVSGSDDFFELLGVPQDAATLAALSITSSVFPATFLPVDINDFGGTTRLSNLTWDGQLRTPNTAQSERGWHLRDNTDVFVNAVPEPGSLAIFGLIGVSGALARRRRRNKQA